MPYFLFLLVTAALFIRPGEIVPDLYAWPIYNYLILACMALSLPALRRQLTKKSLAENPISACVVGLWFAVVISHLSHLIIWKAQICGTEFLKIVIYYLLLVAHVNTQQRLKSFLGWLLVFITLVAALSLLGNYHIMELPGMEFCQEGGGVDQETGQMITVSRLQGTGIFHDPNDLAMILVPGVCLALGFAAIPAAGTLRYLMLPLVGLFGYAIYATQSRGGLLAFMAALMTLFHARWGWKRTALLAAVVLPAILVAFAGRMTSYDLGGGSGQSRVQLWSMGFQAFRQQPIFGIGADNYPSLTNGMVAHNSYVHSYTELGLFGGSLFLGCFVAALTMFYRFRQLSSPSGRGAGGEGTLAENSQLAQLLPYVTAMLVGFAASMFSISRNYVVPTYMMFGLAAAYIKIAGEQSQAPLLRFDASFLKLLARSSACFLLFIYLFIRLNIHF